jgi:2-polyprenyl-6-methoxyphenol hydroxylase-like FAD-dependent oxidoreductase
MKIQVPVQFTGVVDVTVPDGLSDPDAKLLADKIALARVLATCDNPDAPEDDAFEEYEDECSADAKVRAGMDWDHATAKVTTGAWIVPQENGPTQLCDQCGQAFSTDHSGVTFHTDPDEPDGIDHNADADHVAFRKEVT